MVDVIDTVLESMEIIHTDPTQKGIEFIQRKGRLKTILEQAAKTRVKQASSEFPMILQLANIGLKDNFAVPSVRNQVSNYQNYR